MNCKWGTVMLFRMAVSEVNFTADFNWVSPWTMASNDLCQIIVSIFLSCVTFQVFLFDQQIDASLQEEEIMILIWRQSWCESNLSNTYLDCWNFRFKFGGQLIDDLNDEFLMFQCFSHFHDTNDGRINQVATILFDALMCGSTFFHCGKR